MESEKLVSVICLCHNQAGFVREAIDSVLAQSHPNVELIVVDDGSTDKSKEVITAKLAGTAITFINLATNIGNCKAFNKGFLQSKGDYVIDLAGDDVLLPNRIEAGLKTFEEKTYGVTFCNVHYIDEKGHQLNEHFKTGEKIPEGDLYELLIRQHVISAPSMMIKRTVLEELGGYNEALTYEDFDFWIRSARNHHYGYTNQILLHQRRVEGSFSRQQFRYFHRHQKSTLEVCKTIKKLNTSDSERKALNQRLRYEIRNCLRYGNLHLIPAFLKLLA